MARGKGRCGWVVDGLMSKWMDEGCITETLDYAWQPSSMWPWESHPYLLDLTLLIGKQKSPTWSVWPSNLQLSECPCPSDIPGYKCQGDFHVSAGGQMWPDGLWPHERQGLWACDVHTTQSNKVKAGWGGQPSRVLSPQTQRLLEQEGGMVPITPTWQWGNGLGDGTKGAPSLSDVLSAGNRNFQCHHVLFTQEIAVQVKSQLEHSRALDIVSLVSLLQLRTTNNYCNKIWLLICTTAKKSWRIWAI